MFAIEIKNLVKQYKNGVKALNNLSLNVKCGEIFSLLGPNGAGKSSLINILTTMYKQTSGNVIILGKNLSKEPSYIRKQIACVSQNISIDEHLSLLENMMFQSRLYKVQKNIAEKRIKSLIESFKLSQYVNYPVCSYSGGIKRRLDIAMNMVSMPKILFLDEPTVGMDVISRKAMWDIIRKIKYDFKTTIFLTTHYLEEADNLSDTICIIKDGHELIQGTSDCLKEYTRQNILRIGFLDNKTAKDCVQMLTSMNTPMKLNVQGHYILTDAKDGRSTFQYMNRILIEKDTPFQSIEILQPSLEDVFLKLINTERK